jgi:uncharacterized protein with PQ loop repeat
MPVSVVDAVGAVGAVLTTVCWLPQAMRIIRTSATDLKFLHPQQQPHSGTSNR